MGGAPTRRFRYRGRVVEARDGETLLDAIVRSRRAGVPTLERSTRYHRPRGPFCGVGQCTGCLLRVNGRPLVRSCRYRPAEADVVAEGPGWPSVRWDALRVLDLWFRRGLDPFRGFRRPAWAAPVYQRLVRRLGGYGALPETEPSHASPPSQLREADTVIVGGGPAGRAAAERSVALGVRPLVVDRDSAPPVEGADRLEGTTVGLLGPPKAGAAFPFELVGVTAGDAGLVVRARSVVVATGGYDASLLFAGNDLPGVLAADAAVALSPTGTPPPFRRAIVVGGGPRAAELLERLGSSVRAVVALGEIRPEVARAASELGVPLYPRSLLLGVQGFGRVRGLRLRTRGGGPYFTLDSDAVLLAHRRLPNSSLLYLAGAEMAWHGGTAAYYPVVDAAGRTNVLGLYAVGTVGGFVGPAIAESGRSAAEAIAGRPGAPIDPRSRVRIDGPADLEGYYRELLAEPRRGRWVACRCEDVLLSDLEAAHRRGYTGLEVVKRFTSLGTGLCQGRYCAPDAILLLSVLEGRGPVEVGRIRQRPPVHPLSLDVLAELDRSVAPEEAA